ncbi:MAG: dienelactone hydrolase family protein [Ignavibacteriae bacterium]|nr:dienelactone hydrolase family protein [Ignavibacteriota bacterium]MCB9214436.1 dienelactone hydrolase family protein [Ignavibacteria bacterium]
MKFVPTEREVPYTVLSEEDLVSYRRFLLHYQSEDGDIIPAFFLLPHNPVHRSGVLALHQHASQRHIGKSEICGITGDPNQWIGHHLAERGYAVLAPDSICFEDRRRNGVTGIGPHPQDERQHYNEMAYRLVRGETLMGKVLADTCTSLNLLMTQKVLDLDSIAVVGHSYGGNSALFYGALDRRVNYVCASGAACTYKTKLEKEIGLEMALVLPGFLQKFDLEEVIACIYPRELYLLSATHDPYALDADVIEEKMRAKHPDWQLNHSRYVGDHPLTTERLKDILQWFERNVR